METDAPPATVVVVWTRIGWSAGWVARCIDHGPVSYGVWTDRALASFDGLGHLAAHHRRA